MNGYDHGIESLYGVNDGWKRRSLADMTHTAWFDELRKDDIALAGGKGANLGELSHAGLPVPPGFVVTTTARLTVSGAMPWRAR